MLESGADLWGYVDVVRSEIDRALMNHLPLIPVDVGSSFNDALRYSLFPGGKRLRPVLTLLGAELIGGRGSEAMTAAVAVEYVHTSSLIFDDLPCMDNATQRRGLDALHRRYGEGLAVLVALALLNTSYGLVLNNRNATPQQRMQAHQELVVCIGTNGMVTGQTIDLTAVTECDGFDAVRNLKTSALMRLALKLGAILSNADARQLTALSQFAELLGQAYQISDDLLDVAEDAATADGDSRPATFAAERGARDAKLRLVRMAAQAKDVLASEFSRSRAARLLGEIIDYISHRES